MADNTQLNPGAGGDTIATEDVGGGVKVPVSKIYTGARDINGGPVTVTNPLPIGGVDSNGVAVTPSVVIRNGFAELAVSNDMERQLLERVALATEDLRDIRAAIPVASVRADAPTGIEPGLVVRPIVSGVQTVVVPSGVAITNQPLAYPVGGQDVSGLPVLASIRSANGANQLATSDDANRQLLEQILLVLSDIRASLATQNTLPVVSVVPGLN